MIDPNTFPSLTLPILVLGIAFLYSSVGFGGASGYLAAMSLFAIPSLVMSSTALTLNVLVASIAFIAFSRAGHVSWKMIWPFLITSIPAAFIGGYLYVDEQIYLFLLNLTLTFVAIRMILYDLFTRSSTDAMPRSLPLYIALLTGFAIGLLSSMVGVGGGIFLAPLIVITGWGTPKQAAAVSAAFILVNSVSGISGRWAADQYTIGWLGMALLPVGLIGGTVGSHMGARSLSGATMRRLLGIILLLAVARFWLSLL